ncbi:MAG: hypothetical protein KZQ58_12135 [gamma proteobacterium symbiont of Bathyaustriella thionipta]|nr:hypothetical protein [gamma proteobacterium symbiont of Bathyaustriella thionipta]
MLEYIFFDPRPAEQFSEFLRQLEIQPNRSGGTDDEPINIAIAEDTDDEILDNIETFYEQMYDMDEALYAEAAGEEHVHRAGVSISLNDGRTVEASIDPKLLNRILSAISHQELGDFVSAIADAVENPNETAFCRR